MHEKVFKHKDAHKLDSPDRLEWMPPGKLLARLELDSGLVIADIGAGTGYFALPMAAAVGPKGKVFAVDLQPEMLDKLRAKLAEPGAPQNIELFHGSAAATTLASHAADIVFLGNMWHEIDDLDAAMREVERIVAPGGRVAVLDWRTDVARPPGPPIEHRKSAAEVVSTLKARSWSLLDSAPFGSYSYLVTAAWG